MPGYILHMTEAEMILSAIEKKYPVHDPCFRNRFLLGSLLPDVMRGDAKAGTHFWNPEEKEWLAKGPDLKLFLDRYGDQIDSPEMMGYYAHLHLDQAFVKKYWRSEFRFEGDDGAEEILRRRISRVRLKGSDRIAAVEDFFSSAWYYGDYTRMNAYFLERYSLTVPEYQELTGFPVREADPGLLIEVIDELQLLCRKRGRSDEQLKVFKRDKLIAFLEETAGEASAWFLERKEGIHE